MCSFFPRNRQPLLGMPDIRTLSILSLNHNTIEAKEADGQRSAKQTPGRKLTQQ